MSMGIFYGLDRVGSEILDHIQSNITQDDFIQSLHETYGTDLNVLRNDVHEFISKLLENGILISTFLHFVYVFSALIKLDIELRIYCF